MSATEKPSDLPGPKRIDNLGDAQEYMFGSNVTPLNPPGRGDDPVKGLIDMHKRQKEVRDQFPSPNDPRQMNRRQFLGRAAKAAAVVGGSAAGVKLLGHAIDNDPNLGGEPAPQEYVEHMEEQEQQRNLAENGPQSARPPEDPNQGATNNNP